MKWTVIITAIILLASAASASVVINQVLYNPIGSESGGEAVEMYNRGDNDTDISLWWLMTEASQKDASIPANTIICPGCYYLIADSGWNDSRDNFSWAEADHMEPLNLYNSNSGVALVSNNTIIDAVGWGDEAEIDAGLYEGEPADEISEGYALLRDGDTDDNNYDFSSSYPYFRSSSDIGTGSHSEDINVDIGAAQGASISSINITPDEGFGSGVNIFPNPGGEKAVHVLAIIEGEVGNITASLRNASRAMVLGDDGYSCSFELGYGLAPGKYEVIVNVDGSEMRAEFEYMEMVAVRVEGNVDYDEVDPGSSIGAEITVENIGNVPVDIGLSATDLTGENTTIPKSLIEYSLGAEFYRMSSNTQIRDANLAPGKKKDIDIRIMVPEDANGEYSGKITVTGIGTQN